MSVCLCVTRNDHFRAELWPSDDDGDDDDGDGDDGDDDGDDGGKNTVMLSKSVKLK